MRKTLSHLNITATVLFLITLAITYLYPEVTRVLLLSAAEARAIIMTLISLILLVSFLQTHMSLTWRILCLVGSFVVLIESIFVLGSWQRLIK